MFCILPCMFAIRDDSVFFFFAAGSGANALAVPGIAAEAWSHNQNGMGREGEQLCADVFAGRWLRRAGGLAVGLLPGQVRRAQRPRARRRRRQLPRDAPACSGRHARWTPKCCAKKMNL